MKGALDVHARLLADRVPHEVVRLRAPVVSADDLPASLDLPASACGAVRCYTFEQGSRSRLAAVLVRSGCVPDPGLLLEALGVRRLRVATVQEVNAATDFAALLLSPVALHADVVLLVDEELLVAPDAVLHLPAGEARVAVSLRAGDLLAATGGRAVPLGAHPRHPSERPGWNGVVPLPDGRGTPGATCLAADAVTGTDRQIDLGGAREGGPRGRGVRDRGRP